MASFAPTTRAPNTRAPSNAPTMSTYNESLLGLYCGSLLPLIVFFYFVCRAEKKGGFMTAFGIQTGAALILRIVYLSLKPVDYRNIFRMEHGNSLLMFMDLLPEVLKLTSWVTVLSYWRGILSTDDMNRTQKQFECCRGTLWLGCAVVSVTTWVIAFILIGTVYGTGSKYDEVRLIEGVFLFIVSILLGIVGAFLIVRFLIYFRSVLAATSGHRRGEESRSDFSRLIRMRVTYATTLACCAMVIYFTVLLAVAASTLPRPNFLVFWQVLTALDAVVTIIVMWLLAPRTKEAHCLRCRRRKLPIPRGSSSVTGSRVEVSVQATSSQTALASDSPTAVDNDGL